MIWLVVDSRTVGGIERHVAILAEALVQAGERAEVVLFAGYGVNPWCRQLAAANITWSILCC